ncbi:MAG: hypothetical protein V4658_07050 [Bacteroidota bacterium]
MDESIDLPVLYKGENVQVTAKILAYGYTYKLSVDINGTEVLFERDEQQHYRAIAAKRESENTADPALIKAILDTLSMLE